MRHALLLLPASLVLSLSAHAGTGRPDASGTAWTDSLEPDGPPHRWIATSSATPLSIPTNGTQSVDLPFRFTWYGAAYDRVSVAEDGALWFSTPPTTAPSCPGTDPALVGAAVFWSNLDTPTVTTQTLGTYPTRTFVVSWEAFTVPGATGTGRVQAWFMEGRGELAIVLDDVDLGVPAFDGGLGAFVGAMGTHAGGATGLPWSCRAAFASGTSVWFGRADQRPARTLVYTDELDAPWATEVDLAAGGSTLAAGDINGDGLDDVVLGSPSVGGGQASVVFLPHDDRAALATTDADTVIQWSSGATYFAQALALGDLDGDGHLDLAGGAPEDDAAGVSVGSVSIFDDLVLGGARSRSDASRIWLGDASAQGRLGKAIAAGDLDGDGYDDLVVGAPTTDVGADVDVGAVWAAYGGASLPASGSIATVGTSVDGVIAGGSLGRSIAIADLADDGALDVILGAPLATVGGVSSTGLVYVLPALDLPGAATVAGAVTLVGASSGGRFGSTLTAGALDGAGTDLAVAAPNHDTAGYTGTDHGSVYLVTGSRIAGAAAGTTITATPSIEGTFRAGRFGSAMTSADTDADGVQDLIVGAPNAAFAASGAGAAYVFAGLSGGFSAHPLDLDADQTLVATNAGASLGAALTSTFDGERATTWLGAPGDTLAYTGEGLIYSHLHAPDFADRDSDGFVDAQVGGNDCDDDRAAANPARTELAANGVDDDCDGWIDDLVRLRLESDEWDWDVDERNGMPAGTWGFEGLGDGTSVTSTGPFAFASALLTDDLVYGTVPVDTLGARVAPGDDADLTFSAPVRGLSFQILDPDGTVTFAAYAPGGALLASWSLDLAGDDRPAGAFVGLTFNADVARLVIRSGADGIGLDALRPLLASASDDDGDGATEDGGDCDDADASVGPGADEVLANAIDDDCDGIVDAGDLRTWSDATTWASAVSLDVTDVIDFETLADGAIVGTTYNARGVVFLDTTARADIDGTAPNGVRAAQGGATLDADFAEHQPGVAFTLLDAEDPVTLTLWSDGVVVYTSTLAAGSAFVGLDPDMAFDRMSLASAGTFGIDDLTFSALGLDDADGDGVTERGGDCDDTDASIAPGATESWYDGVDADCAGDDDFDADGDGFALGVDCDDTEAGTSPDAVETWYDGIDADCDGASDFDADADGHDDAAFGGDDCDDGDMAVAPGALDVWYDGIDADCAGNDDYDADSDGIPGGPFASATDCDDTDATIYPGAAETPYDGIDSDCAGAAISDYDADGDGFDATAWGGTDCEDADVNAFPGAPGEACYDGVDQDCDGASDYDCDLDGYDADLYGGADCDDEDAAVRPGAADTMGDGVDTNCDGALEFDDDGDGHDDAVNGGDDCDDDDATVFPGAVDACYDGVDSDCGGEADDDCDGDGSPLGLDCDDEDAGRFPEARDFPYDGVDADCAGDDDFDRDGDGFTTTWYGGVDCDDTHAAVFPGAPDAPYDGVDSDCDGTVEGDVDGDGFTSVEVGGLDCDDGDASVRPGAPDAAGDGVDSDCDGVDPSVVTCEDCDADGFAGGDDCDDTNATVFPGATDRAYDGIDADCAGNDDFDADGDGARAAAWGGADCDDSDASRHPGATDACGNGDDDCDGTTDEDCVIDADTGGDTADTGSMDTAADTGDTGSDTSDTGDSGDTGTDSGGNDSASDVDPDPTDDVAPEAPETIDAVTDTPSGCGCASGPEPSSGAGALAIAVAMFARRRRARP